ncbi:polysaccharide deacetylase family protein [Steroidobacter sp. S1-65]|uniref:Polysaccharide deacetylase family protein n=1 Tax=Steroidobacter gossypii TaxID=2805490 RepID=A0ABS1X384_9GAMM|nr:polysaccharide deacetylase family protein [Steroidobacter gossypii]MBM0107688.1 polysaccharide deacetylase family protein [Steroidobacter gossypii]
MTADRVYLTFDDGPDPEWTPRVLDTLADAGVKATFFAVGQQALRSPDLMRRVHAAGHAIGNHTYSHRHPWFMFSRAARAQVRDGAKALSDVLGVAPQFYRPPHGRQRACMSDEAQRCGERVVLWDVSAIDWGPMGSADNIEKRLAAVKGGDIVLMHDGRNQHNRPDQLLQILPLFLRKLSDRGLRTALLPS